ncbi:copper resistance CopC family protein [Methylocystis bryophila]|uniref:copper resistance CopC family protein n=1 Tax=Methylocystis bryophila TaxID=655015 RepID=UPI003DB131E6
MTQNGMTSWRVFASVWKAACFWTSALCLGAAAGDAAALTLIAPTSKSPIALAHAIVVRRSPTEGGVAAGNIGRVDVCYDAGIRDSLAALAVVSEGGERVDKRDASIDSADPSHVSVSVNPLNPGKYTVRYRALSADGHLVSGAWDFEVKP